MNARTTPLHTPPRTLFAAQALLPDGWHRDVLLHWDDAGTLTSVEAGCPDPGSHPRAHGPLLPGMPNLHSHAFQRAMAGRTEYVGRPDDSFWSWRTLMYQFAGRITPEGQEAIARHLYIEMLKAGYTSVCEFHYVHHAPDGKPYANPAELAARIAAAGESAGIGVTLLPVLYQYSGFGEQPPLPGQARFLNTPEGLLDLVARLRAQHPENGNRRYGVAPHSLRAVSHDSLTRLSEGLSVISPDAPIHIHIAEQRREVDDCIAVHGTTPVALLLDTQPVDARWCLVHATHMTRAETEALAASRAIAGICPSTEGNLGDGIFDGTAYLRAGGRWGIGSDSHVTISAAEELRWFEYTQRLHDQRRNVLTNPRTSAIADGLYLGAVDGGAAAAGRNIAGLAPGQRADFVVLDAEHPDIGGRPDTQTLAGYVFCQHGESPVRDVFVGGRQVVSERRHADEAAARAAYRDALAMLMA
ncbi:N-formimino-L-glutamate deiminase [Pandoraea terrae]|uniref:N-formimino-L-glutamate deiminase n=1 Tax=Pandoraea terrae TaxID=1537710 RepID=A0A5E4RS53_9BURK|nr:formimidoylglutamate deiminase [Pandoraea terrae]VVD65591.1 N-formimino-L-glutamate deiminase [Pandoraea terrae]